MSSTVIIELKQSVIFSFFLFVFLFSTHRSFFSFLLTLSIEDKLKNFNFRDLLQAFKALKAGKIEEESQFTYHTHTYISIIQFTYHTVTHALLYSISHLKVVACTSSQGPQFLQLA